jgi:hypothetical protein
MRRRRGETVPALLSHRLASLLALLAGDHLRRPHCAPGCSGPIPLTESRARAGGAQIITRASQLIDATRAGHRLTTC